MKNLIPILVFLIIATSLQARDTAYAALRTMADNSKQEYLNQVLEVTGKQGTPQPSVWRITLSDPEARGGIREFEVSSGKILSERTPTQGFNSTISSVPLKMTNLNLDSDGAFSVANNAAVNQKVKFDAANYALQVGNNGRPVWRVSLVDIDGIQQGTVEVNADNGDIIQTLAMNPVNSSTASTPTSSSSDSEVGGAIGATRDTLKKVGNSTKNVTLRTLGSIQEWATGNRTIDKDVPKE